MPVHNEAEHLPATIDALVAATKRSPFQAELVLVDDGSSDGSAAVAEQALGGRMPLRVVMQPNSGRFEARRAGLGNASGELVLLLDARVRLDVDALAFIDPFVRAGDRVWASHVHVEDRGNPLGVFWRLIAELAWSEYFDHPRTTSFGSDDFDRFPKGTTAFLAPRQLLLEAVAAFRSHYDDPRRANDDTPLLRWVAERERIHVSPMYSSTYAPRLSLRSFVRHSFHRGVVFVDGHGRPESRFFPAFVAFYPLSALLALAAVRRPPLALYVAGVVSATAAGLGLARRRRAFEIASLALVAPVYGIAHGTGMWRGLILSRHAVGGWASRVQPGDERRRVPPRVDARR
jgi:glycosyltransferase involved in cell wall biosynthesis